MQGFTPMTPEEHKEGNPLRSARPACHLEKKVTLMTTLLASVASTFTQITAVLHHEGRLASKKSSNVLAAIEEMKATASLAVDIEGMRGECHDEEEDLPELTDGNDSDSEDGFLDQESHEIAEHAGASSNDVAGTISTEGYEELEEVRSRGRPYSDLCLSNFWLVDQGLIRDGTRMFTAPSKPIDTNVEVYNTFRLLTVHLNYQELAQAPGTNTVKVVHDQVLRLLETGTGRRKGVMLWEETMPRFVYVPVQHLHVYGLVNEVLAWPGHLRHVHAQEVEGAGGLCPLYLGDAPRVAGQHPISDFPEGQWATRTLVSIVVSEPNCQASFDETACPIRWIADFSRNLYSISLQATEIAEEARLIAYFADRRAGFKFHPMTLHPKDPERRMLGFEEVL
eukprot:gene3227-4071_t